MPRIAPAAISIICLFSRHPVGEFVETERALVLGELAEAEGVVWRSRLLEADGAVAFWLLRRRIGGAFLLDVVVLWRLELRWIWAGLSVQAPSGGIFPVGRRQVLHIAVHLGIGQS